MDRIDKLTNDCKKLLRNNVLDNDVKVNITISDIKHWCNEFLRINQNIEETSISPSHKIERKQKLLNDVLNI